MTTKTAAANDQNPEDQVSFNLQDRGPQDIVENL